MADIAVDPDLVDDLVGVATTRLVAAGVPRANRVRAMRMLAILSTVADGDLVVRQPVGDLAAEFDFPVEEARRAIEALEQVSVVHHVGPGLRLSARETAVGGMRLVDFVELTEDEPAPRGVLARTLAIRPVAAAALAAVLILTGAVVGTRLAAAPTERPLVAEGTPPAGAATTDKQFPHGRLPNALPAIDVPADAALPVPVASTTTLVLATCPSGAPSLRVDGTVADADGLLSVEGTATNPLPAAIRVSAMSVYVTAPDGTATMYPLDQAISVPGRGTAHWQARMPVRAASGSPATAQVDHWGWVDPTLASRCAAA